VQHEQFLEAPAAVTDAPPGPLVLPWTMTGNPGGFMSFAEFTEWQAFVRRLGLSDYVR
jgi:hypothetical protein